MSTNANTSNPRKKSCFVVSEFGRDEKTRAERTQTLRHLVKKVIEPLGYTVQRADDIDDVGQITHQIIERLLDDDLVVADLTGLNPNVFYELAVRHAARKPVITLMTDGEDIPFDLKDVRTVFYDLHDPDKLESAQEDLKSKVEAIEANAEEIRNPITVARNVTLLQQSSDPEVQAAGAVLAAVNELRDEMRMMLRRGASIETQRAGKAMVPQDEAERRIHDLFAKSDSKFSTNEVADYAGSPLRWTDSFLNNLANDNQADVFRVDGEWSAIPF